MANGSGKHWAVFGLVAMRRALCPECRRTSLILDGKLLCCGIREDDSNPSGFISECDVKLKRRTPNLSEKRHILKMQDFKCFYCDEELIQINWDHFFPFSYTKRNDLFVAACPLCNSIKSNLIFETGEEARAYVREKRREKKLRRMRREI